MPTNDIKPRIKRITALYLIIFLAIILLISLYINMSSFRKQFISNELSFYSIGGSRIVDNIENGLLYGKSLDNYYGMDRLVKSWSEKTKEVRDIRLLSPDKQEIYYQLDQDAGDSPTIDDSIYLEIRDSGGKICGYLNIAVDLTDRLELLRQIRSFFLAGAAGLFLTGAVTITAFCRICSFVDDDYRIDKRKILRFMLLLILLLQAVFTIFSSAALRDFYIEISSNTGHEIQVLVQADIDRVIAEGVTYDQIYEFESYAADVIEKAPMIESIELDGEQLNITISEKYIETAINKMLLDMLTVLITSMFIAAEIINHMMISINGRMKRVIGEAAYDKLLSIRASSFLIHVACYLPVSFIPILMYRLTGGNASDFILGLPVMVLFAAGFLFTILAGNWSVRYGWRKLLFAGVGLVIFSSLLAGLIANAAVLVIARGLYGAAYSLIYVAIREFAAAGEDRKGRSEGLAQVTAGLYAGINIGAVLGALIYESVGFRGVFAISAAVGILAVFTVKNHCVSTKASAEETEQEAASFLSETAAMETGNKELSGKELPGKGMLSIIKDREMARLTLFIIAPLAITSLFFEYFLPVYAVKAEIGSADIGRAFLINGIAIAYIAPLVVKHFSAGMNEKVRVFLFTALMAVGFIIFGFTGGLAGILIASAVMGIAEGAALVSQNMIMLDLAIAEKAGTGRMLSFYATVRKLAQTAGPQIFAACMFIGYETGMIVFGGAVAACSVIYIRSDRRNT